MLTAGLLELGREEERFMRELGTFARGKIEHAVIIGNQSEKARQAFIDGFGQPVWSELRVALEPGTLLLCVGRLPRATIRSLLP